MFRLFPFAVPGHFAGEQPSQGEVAKGEEEKEEVGSVNGSSVQKETSPKEGEFVILFFVLIESKLQEIGSHVMFKWN